MLLDPFMEETPEKLTQCTPNMPKIQGYTWPFLSCSGLAPFHECPLPCLHKGILFTMSSKQLSDPEVVFQDASYQEHDKFDS